MKERIEELEKQVAELTAFVKRFTPIVVPLRIGEHREVIPLTILAEQPAAKGNPMFRILD